MSAVEWSEFGDFFAAFNEGARPFPWQQRLIDGLATTGVWPDVVNAPTGSGKSVPVLAHVFANAAAASTGVRVPRRLVTVVNRRSLVDSQHDQALLIQRKLAEQEEDGSLLHRVRVALEGLTPRPKPPLGGFTALQLRGKVHADTRWVDDPAACAVIAATPDMWGSRLLFRGYGSARFAWPREAGLFAYDCVAALDETHLNQQLALTALRVRDLATPHAEAIGVPALQVMRLSATQDGGSAGAVANQGGGARPVEVGVESADLEASDTLAERLTRPKPVSYVETAEWPAAGTANAKYVSQLVDEVLRVREGVAQTEGAARTVGCLVNRVETAAAVVAELDRKGLQTQPWVGRMRPYDLARAKAERPGLFTVAGDDAVDVLVATSTVEVGVDIDLAGLVTELCPGTSLAQRFGRINRLGRRDHAPITVVGPRVDEAIKDAPPYVGADLEAAREWVLVRSDDPSGAAPWALTLHPAPPATLSRVVLERLEPGIVEILAATSEEPFTDLTLDRWLQDDFDPERENILLVPRRFSGPADADGERTRLEDTDLISLLTVTPVLDAEAFPATYQLAKYFVEGILTGDLGHDPRVVDMTDPTTPTFLTDAKQLRSGGVYVVDDDVRLARRGIVAKGVGGERSTPVLWGPTPRPELSAFSSWPGAAGAAAVAELARVNEVVDLDAEGLVFLPGDRDGAGVEWCAELAGLDGEALIAAVAAVHQQRRVDVKLPPAGADGTDDVLPWVVFLPSAEVGRDEETRQEWTPSPWVELDKHQHAVAGRAEALASRLGLPEAVAQRLFDAGVHHDDGKRAAGFQARLREGISVQARQEVDGVLLAKSGVPRAVQLSTRGRHLPPGWRHEQMSVAWARAVAGVTDPLTLRLIGSSHGRGRSGFAHLTSELLVELAASTDGAAVADEARELFDHGDWEQLIDATSAKWGQWGCAYLEAVVRGADCQVSEEGS